jgi:hypothetical protein
LLTQTDFSVSVAIFQHEIVMLFSDETKYQIALARELGISIKAKPILCAASNSARQPTASLLAITTATEKPTSPYSETELGMFSKLPLALRRKSLGQPLTNLFRQHIN